jgi:hypothetical protein
MPDELRNATATKRKVAKHNWVWALPDGPILDNSHYGSNFRGLCLGELRG